MHDIPSRDVFAKLNDAVRAVAPETILGLTFAVDEGLSVLYQLGEGFGRYLLPVADVPEILRPQLGPPRHGTTEAFAAAKDGALEWQFQFAGVKRLVSLTVPN